MSSVTSQDGSLLTCASGKGLIRHRLIKLLLHEALVVATQRRLAPDIVICYSWLEFHLATSSKSRSLEAVLDLFDDWLESFSGGGSDVPD